MTKLPLRVKQTITPVPEKDWILLQSEAAAVNYALKETKRLDKSVAIDADLDSATLSRAKVGQARLSETDLHAFMDATGSEAPLIAMMLRRGYDPRCLRKLETEQEHVARLLREELEAERVKVRVLTEALRGNTP